MSKYDPLRDHLRSQTLGEIVLTFKEIEALIGPLPPSAERPQFWANVKSVSSPQVQREAWRAAGYDAFLIAGLRRVRFVRVGPGAPTRPVVPPPSSKPLLTADALLAGGFEFSSRWVLSEEGRLALERPLPVTPGVYAFVINGVAVYIGIASSGLARRLAFYIRPDATQRTSQRVGARLVTELQLVGSIDILTAAPPDTTWNGWPIKTGAGLEVGIIGLYDVTWNLRGA